jgi:hypothetical protein
LTWLLYCFQRRTNWPLLSVAITIFCKFLVSEMIVLYEFRKYDLRFYVGSQSGL